MTAGEVWACAFDADNNTIKFFVGGSQTGNTISLDSPNGLGWKTYAATGQSGSVDNSYWNYGQDSSFAGEKTSGSAEATDGEGIGDFYYTPPSGYLALCTANLPEPTIGANSVTQADDYFNTVLYTGASSGQGITGVGFQPDWTWIKSRSHGSSHVLTDTSRGVTKSLFSDTAVVESTLAGGVTAFGTDGFTLGTEGTVNTDTRTYVAWSWKANGGTATASGSESGNNPAYSVQANPTAGFSIVTYTGTGATGTVPHGLGVVPQMMIFKNRGSAGNWAIYHGENTAAPATDVIYLNLTNATADTVNMFNDTAPTSSVFTVDTNGNLNEDGVAHVAYIFANVEGYSKFGSYTGNGNVDGAFVYTGFRPAFIITKLSSHVSSWSIVDTTRDPFNIVNQYLLAESNSAEGDFDSFDILSNGFKARTTNAERNGSGRTVIYMAFAEAPFKYANAR